MTSLATGVGRLTLITFGSSQDVHSEGARERLSTGLCPVLVKEAGGGRAGLRLVVDGGTGDVKWLTRGPDTTRNLNPGSWRFNQPPLQVQMSL